MATRIDLHIPDDVVVEILQLFPLKSLGRFLCVCKKWRSMILDPMSNSKEEELLLISTSSIQSIDFTEPEIKPVTLLQSPVVKDNFYVVGSVNGLLLCLDTANSALNLFNPLTQKRQRIKVTDFPKPLTREGYVYGFGYEKSNDNYVIVIMDRENYNRFTWSSNTQIWVPFFGSLDLGLWTPFYSRGFYANGCICWGIYWGEKFGALCFDLKTCKFNVIEGPKILEFGVLRDRFIATEFIFDFSMEGQQYTDVWKLDGQMQWIKIMTIPRFTISPLLLNDDHYELMSPVLLLKNGGFIWFRQYLGRTEARWFLSCFPRMVILFWFQKQLVGIGMRLR